MHRTCSLASIALTVFLISATCGRTQETNLYPKSHLELFEERTGIVLIRGTADIGVVPGQNGSVTVKLRETKDISLNQREYGVIISVASGNGGEGSTYVDYDELGALIQNLDYVSKVDWAYTSLMHFDASYTTRAGFKVLTYSSRRSGLIEGAVVSYGLSRSRASLSIAQLGQLRITLDLAKTKIEDLQKSK